MSDIRSSYIQNDFGKLLYTYVVAWRPVNLVELGVLDGYSTLHIAKGVKEIDKLYGVRTKLTAIDLFEDYPYKHGNKDEVQKLLDENEVSKYVNLMQGDAYKRWDLFEDKVVEFLHIDISNTGEVIKNIMELWFPKLRERAIVCIEGGSEERDNIEWMTKYNMPSIKKEIETNRLINDNFFYGTYFAFPSMTVMLRKWG